MTYSVTEEKHKWGAQRLSFWSVLCGKYNSLRVRWREKTSGKKERLYRKLSELVHSNIYWNNGEERKTNMKHVLFLFDFKRINFSPFNASHKPYETKRNYIRIFMERHRIESKHTQKKQVNLRVKVKGMLRPAYTECTKKIQSCNINVFMALFLLANKAARTLFVHNGNTGHCSCYAFSSM